LNTTLELSAVSKIDGVDAAYFLEQQTQLQAMQDSDAAYNNLFYELTQNVVNPLETSGPGFFVGGIIQCLKLR
jgi:hypothetical protein